tara:strand:- start:4126 stop:4920 length:795 start_codon:yes stop_codon:yes gene_type:complete
MSDSFQKDIVSESDYSKYLEEIKNYYNLKNKYTSHNQTFINKLINSDDSIESKKKLYSKHKFKCVSCGNVGGTIFKENNKILRATCGNTSEPCKLNLEIVKFTPILIDNELKETNNSLTEKKKKIVLTKLDFLFNYIEEDKAVELFENLKSDITNIQEKYNELFLLYNSITCNAEIEELLNQKLVEQTSFVNEFKDIIKIYNDTLETRYLKDAMFLYTNKIKQLDEHILTLKYKYNNVDNREEDSHLLQYKYYIKNLEVIKKPE